MRATLARFAAESGTAQRIFHLQQQVPQGGAATSKQRAIDSMRALNHNFASGTPGLFYDHHFGWPLSWVAPTAPVWDHSQGIGAGLDLAKVTGDRHEANQMLGALNDYAARYYRGVQVQFPTGAASRFGTPTLKFLGRPMLAYAPGTGGSSSAKGVGPTLYYDDNSWIGLDLMQAYHQTNNRTYLHKAEALFPFISSGQQRGGGMIWSTASAASHINTPATAASTEYALRLYQATHNSQYLRFASKNISFMNQHLRAPSGLYYDGVVGSSPSKNFYSYNQGTGLGANLLYYQVTKNKRYLDNAVRTANASLAYFQQPDPHGGNRFWHQPPSFNAIYFRNLLQLNQAAPNPAYRKALDDYLNLAWEQGRDPHSGLFTRGGIAHYGSTAGNYLDQAAMVQLYALSAWPAKDLHEVS